MSSRLRKAASILLAGSVMSFIFYLHAGGPHNPFPEEGDYPFVTSRICKKCHAEIYEEWSLSYHALAWNDELVQGLSDNFRKVDCIPCHAPAPVLFSQVGASPLPREKMRKTGVNCLSCHRVDDGVATRNSYKNVPCRPVEDNRIGSVALCRSCHNLHGTVDDWERSSLKNCGKDCIFCHMPVVERKDGGATKSHRWLGGHSKEMVAKAIRLSARIENHRLLVEIENEGAGHNVPTELRHRTLDLHVNIKRGWWDRENHEYRFRNPYKGEEGANTQIKFAERRRFFYNLPSGSGEVKIVLIYRLMPQGKGSKGITIHELSLPFSENNT